MGSYYRFTTIECVKKKRVSQEGFSFYDTRLFVKSKVQSRDITIDRSSGETLRISKASSGLQPFFSMSARTLFRILEGIQCSGGTWTISSSGQIRQGTSMQTKQKARKRLTGRLPSSWLLTVLSGAGMIMEKVSTRIGECWCFKAFVYTK